MSLGLLLIAGCARLACHEIRSSERAATSFETYELQACYRKLLVPVEIAGQTLFFVLDTGDSGEGSIDSRVAGELGLPTDPARRMLVAGAHQQFVKVKIFLVDELRIAGRIFRNLSFGEDRWISKLADEPDWDCPPPAGVIGMALLERRPLYLDLVRYRFAFPDGGWRLSQEHAMPYSRQRREASLEVTINGHRVPGFLLDTGAGTSDINQSVADELDLPGIEGKTSDVVDSVGAVEALPLVRAESFCVGEMCVRELEMLSVGYHDDLDGEHNGIVGVNFLLDHRFLLNFAAGKLFYE